MQTRPKALTFLAAIFLAVILSFPIQIMFLHGHGLSEFSMVLAKISILNWFVILTGAFSVWSMLRANPSTKVAVPLFIVSVLWNNWVVGATHKSDYTMWTTIAASAGLLMVTTLLLRENVRQLILHPENRWWLTPIRKRVQIPILVNPLIGESFKTATFDLSEGGAFIPMESAPTGELPWTEVPATIKPGDQLTIAIKIGTLRKIRCDAEVVRKMDANGNYPGGLGIRFKEMDRTDKRELVRYLDQQNADLFH